MSIETERALLTRLMDEAVEMSLRHVEAGGIPFTALVADGNGIVLGSGVNRVTHDSDPTAHAEVVAIRDAARGLTTPYLEGTTLIASGEPCPMCYLSALFARVRRIVFAVDRHGAARAGFDYRGTYDLFATDPTQWPIEVHHLETRNAYRPFERWQARQGA